MQPRPVAVAPRFLFSACLAAYLAVITPAVSAQEATSAEPRYLAALELHTEAELLSLLERSDELLQSGTLSMGTASPVKFVLHGPEVRVLLRSNYLEYKDTVDLAAKLSAFGVIDLQVCETWMGGNRVDASELPPFVESVPYAPAEKRRLIKEESYVYF